MQYLTLGLGSIEQGLIYAILALGVFVSLRVLDIPDMTVDGSFITGAAVSVMVTQLQEPFGGGILFPILSLIVAFFAGTVTGIITGLLHTRLKVPALLAGILTMTGLYSINLIIMGDKPTVSINGLNTIFTPLINLMGGDAVTRKIAIIPVMLVILLIAIIALVWFLRTQVGMALRATGDNEEMVKASSINADNMKVLGLAIANGIVALAGAVLAQDQTFADAKSGAGTVVVGIASIIIGETIFGKRSLLNNIISAVLGAIVYRIFITIVLQFGLPASYFKLLSALIVIIAICVQVTGEKIAKKKTRRANKNVKS